MVEGKQNTLSPNPPLGSFAAVATASWASLILASLALRDASASAVSEAAEHPRHFRVESGFRACVLVKLVGGHRCLHMLHGSGSPCACPLPLRASYALIYTSYANAHGEKARYKTVGAGRGQTV